MFRFLSVAVVATSASFFALEASAQAVCAAVLNPEVFNAGSTDQIENFASSFKVDFCQTEWQSESDIQQRAFKAAYSYESALEIIGLSASDASSSDKRSAAFKQFCARNAQSIAFSRVFFNKYRSSDLAINAWRHCVDASREGVFAASVPSPDLTGTGITIRNTRQGAVPALKVNFVTPSGEYKIDCLYRSIDITKASFPRDQDEVSIQCLKTANLTAVFSIDTNWGVLGPFTIDGFGGTINNLHSELAALKRVNEELRQQITQISTDIRESSTDIRAQLAKKVSDLKFTEFLARDFVDGFGNAEAICNKFSPTAVMLGLKSGVRNDVAPICVNIEVTR